MKKLPLALTFDDVLLSPQYSEIRSRKDVVLATKLSPKKDLVLSLPFISANMDTVTGEKMAEAMAQEGGLGVIHRFMSAQDQSAMIKRLKKNGLLVGAAFGVKEGEMERAELLSSAGADLLVLDIAHGHSVLAIESIREIRRRLPKVFLVAGNVATAQGVIDLARAGADAIKVGIGGGSVCTTRMTTGFGVPQMTALWACVPAARKMGVGLIADGGIRSSGDIVKALAAGADAVMIGNILAGSDQAPGEEIVKQGVRFKKYRGMSSYEANLYRQDRSVNLEELIIEGVSGLVPCRGDVHQIIHQLEGGLRSGLSYAGANNLSELRKNAHFIRITAAGREENGPHGIIT